MKTILRWAGSKTQLLPKLRQFWKDGYARYVEPFAGSSCLFFDLEPRQGILGDLNWELMTALRALRSDAELVIQCLKRLPTGKENYYRIRTIDPQQLSPAELSARFLYLNRFCFNGLYRTNLSGMFNVPYAQPKSKVRFDEVAIVNASRALQRSSLIHGDFEVTLSYVREGDFVYLDPPYAVTARRVFREYLPSSFSNVDLPRLKRSLEQLAARDIAFVITYADSRESRRLLAPWKPRRVWVRRNIAGFAAARRGYYELLASNIDL
jgi:DNA adenine methylase